LNVSKCKSAAGLSRHYDVIYNNGNPLVGSTDRGQDQENATFITAETGYLSAGGAQGIFWSGGAQNTPLGIGRKITVRSWKEKASRP
jgi:hypothetical protein